MTTIIIISVAITILGIAYFWKKFQNKDTLDTFTPKETADNLAEPIISYTLYALDTRLNRRIEMQSPKEFNNQFGILNGQTIELHWNIINADWISIEGVGFVQAIGKKEFYPTKNTQYKIIAKNRNHTEEIVFFVRVFPVPVMEKLMVKMPEIRKNNIDLFKTQIPSIKRLDSINFPTFNLPSVIQIKRDHTAVKPKVIALNEIVHQQKVVGMENNNSFKSKLFDKMENSFKDNYKIKDIIQTIRKHYDN